MDKFYIDRQFGQPIFIDVEMGIVQNCYNESENFNNKMNEHYKGKEISFLKTDFENRMKGTYHNVRSLSVCTALNKIDAVKSKIQNINNLIGSLDSKNSRIPELKETIKEYEIEQSKFEKELISERQRMISEHKYNFPV
jgi:hypothetical protein